ncbi:MAG: Asp23/Gls24 family envelope stress response protein [Clostridia bacterium]|nr:Asp23/Gls24 family envelope stress response protein [Clostridia bacterium]
MENENNDNKDLEVVEEVGLQNSEGIRIANDVIAVIAGKAATEVPGVFGMAGGLGISEVFGKKNMSKGIKVEAGEKETRIDVHIIVDYGVRIPDIAFEIQNRVKKAVETMTGLTVVEVNVHVQGVNVIDEKAQKIDYID